MASYAPVEAADPIITFAADAQISSSDVKMWGLGVMQNIDAADMKLYTLFREYEFDLELARGGAVQDSAPLEDFQVIVAGGVLAQGRGFIATLAGYARRGTLERRIRRLSSWWRLGGWGTVTGRYQTAAAPRQMIP